MISAAASDGGCRNSAHSLDDPEGCEQPPLLTRAGSEPRHPWAMLQASLQPGVQSHRVVPLPAGSTTSHAWPNLGIFPPKGGPRRPVPDARTECESLLYKFSGWECQLGNLPGQAEKRLEDYEQTLLPSVGVWVMIRCIYH